MSQIIVHKVPVCNWMSHQKQKELIEAYRAAIRSAGIPGYHIYLPDDGSGKGGITVIDDHQSHIQRKVARMRAFQFRRMGFTNQGALL